MSRVVLDASVVLAVLAIEPGAERVLPHLGDAVISTVNLAEVQGKLVAKGVPKEDAWEDAISVAQEVSAFDIEQANLAGSLMLETRPLGLSLGDRACLALGMILNAPVYTTDRAWSRLKLKIKVHVIR